MSEARLLALFFPACWSIWGLIWAAAAFSVKKTTRSEDPLSRFSNTAPIWICGLLLLVPQPGLAHSRSRSFRRI